MNTLEILHNERKAQSAYVYAWLKRIAETEAPFIPGVNVLAVVLAHRARGKMSTEDKAIWNKRDRVKKLADARKVAEWAKFTAAERHAAGYRSPQETLRTCVNARVHDLTCSQHTRHTRVHANVGVNGKWEVGKVEETPKARNDEWKPKYRVTVEDVKPEITEEMKELLEMLA